VSIPHLVDSRAIGIIDVSDTPSEPAEPQHGEWVDLRTASIRLGISERSIYRRIARKTLTGRQGMHGRAEVWIPMSDASMTHASEDMVNRYSPLGRREMHAAYMAKIAELAEENGRLKAENERLAHAERERRSLAEQRRPSFMRWMRRFFLGGNQMTMTLSASKVTKAPPTSTQMRAF
jgi:hypothetical protein